MTNKSLRSKIILLTTIILLFILVHRLFTVSVVDNEEYLNYADNKISREIPITAARGNIYDRDGELIAGTKPTYVVKIYKDELFRLDNEERNEYIVNLVKYLEEDGASYLEETDLGANRFVFENMEEYKETTNLNRKVVDILKNNDLVEEFILSGYESKGEINFHHNVVDGVIKQLEEKNIYLPIDIIPGKKVQLKYNDEYDPNSNNNDENNEENANLSEKELLMKNIEGNDSILLNLLSHPINRKIAYDILKKNNLQGNIKLEELVFSDDISYIENKGALASSFRNINLDSDPMDDFYEIVYNSSLEEFLQGLLIDDEYNMHIPAKDLIDKLEEKGIESDITYEVDKDAKEVKLSYKSGDSELGAEKPVIKLINLGKEYGLFRELILDDYNKYVAQEAMFNNGIYPNIYLDTWEYTFTKNKRDLLDRYDLEDDASPEDLFELKKEYNDLDNENFYESYFTLSIVDRVRSRGYYAYSPVKLAYRLSNDTVALISESIPIKAGIEVDNEPVRYYPNNELASHIIGYMGKISQDFEIKKYIEEKGYDPSDVIGKSGLEESYESSLNGTDGKKIVKVDNLGNRTEIISEVEPVPGNNLYLNLDLDVQRTTESALKEGIDAISKGEAFKSKWGDYNYGEAAPQAKSAAAVVMDVKTGGIVAMASYPSYDPNLFSTGITNSDWESLMGTSDDILAARPLLNMAMQTAVQPGSTFKTVSRMAALEKGFDPYTVINSTGVITIGDVDFKDWIYPITGGGHGPVNLMDAIRDSINYYFYCLALGEDPNAGIKLSTQVTVDDLEKTINDVGLNETTGIDINIPSESVGSFPSRDIKLTVNKSILRRNLQNNLKDFIKPGVEKTDKEYNDDIEEIVSWLEVGSSMTRDEVSNKLEEMNYLAEEVPEGEYTNLTDQIKYNYLNQVEWTRADSMSTIIGQGQNAYTPLQMVRTTALIANNGNRLQASLVNNIKNYDNTSLIYEAKNEPVNIGYKDSTFQPIHEGMYMMANTGTAGTCFSSLPFKVAAKTGTAEVDGIDSDTGQPYDNYAWMISYAPYDDPKYAVAVMMPQGSAGGYLAPIVREIFGACMEVNPEE